MEAVSHVRLWHNIGALSFAQGKLQEGGPQPMEGVEGLDSSKQGELAGAGSSSRHGKVRACLAVCVTARDEVCIYAEVCMS